MKIPFINLVTGPWGGGSGDDKGDSREPKNPCARKPGQFEPTPNIDETIDKLKKKFSDSWGGGNKGDGNPFSIKTVVAASLVLLALWLATGFYRVQEGDLAVVLRFGEMVRTSGAGLQYHVPAPIERVLIQKVAAVNTIDGGMRTDKNGEATDQSLILTGDENMVHTNYTVLWKIKDISEFLFTTRMPEATIKVAAESAIREIIGQTAARSALTEGRDLIGTQAQTLLQKILDQYKMGVQIISVQLQNVSPPHEVVESFNDVQASLVDADRDRNEAEAYRNDIIPRARGQAVQILQDAQAVSEAKVADAKGEVGRFSAVYAVYRQNKSIALKRYYYETMKQILLKSDKIILDPKVGGNGVLPYMSIDELKKKASAAKGEIK